MAVSTHRQAGTNPIVIVLGAGATKACGGPLTNEILHEAFQLSNVQERQINLEVVNDFLIEQFRVPLSIADRSVADYPSLPLVMSLVDIAIDRKHSFGENWNIERMAKLRQALDLAIYAVLQYGRYGGSRNLQKQLFVKLGKHTHDFAAISLNYDVLPDNALANISSTLNPDEKVSFADYGCDIFVPEDEGEENAAAKPHNRSTFGRLLKLHGSLNWYYCPHCQRLDLAISEDGDETTPALQKFVQREHSKKRTLKDRYEDRPDGPRRCEACKAEIRPVLISPSLYKDYRNPHVSRIWYEAEMVLRRASKVVFIGYSFPEDDVHVAYLMKRALQGLEPGSITVVEYSSVPTAPVDNPVHRRYQALFGKGFNWFDGGLELWLDEEAERTFQGSQS